MYFFLSRDHNNIAFLFVEMLNHLIQI